MFRLLLCYFILFEVKLSSIFVDDDIKGNARLECRSDVEGRTKFANSNLLNDCFNQISYSFMLIPFILELSHEWFFCPTLRHDFSISSFIHYLIDFNLTRWNI
jgi:hypothetical protein